MTQSKTGAFPTGRIPQIIGKAALAVSLVSGGATLLSTGGAMAQLNPASSGTLNGYTVSGLPTIQSTLISPVGGDFTVVSVIHDFTTNPSNGVGGELKYSISSALYGDFIGVAVDSNSLATPTTNKKEVYSDASFSTLIWSNTSGNGDRVPSVGFQSFSTGLSYPTIYVKDTYTTGAGGELDNISNTFKTPGPLPILGAGAAFGFSRKLRSRIKGARLS